MTQQLNIPQAFSRRSSSISSLAASKVSLVTVPMSSAVDLRCMVDILMCSRWCRFWNELTLGAEKRAKASGRWIFIGMVLDGMVPIYCEVFQNVVGPKMRTRTVLDACEARSRLLFWKTHYFFSFDCTRDTLIAQRTSSREKNHIENERGWWIKEMVRD